MTIFNSSPSPYPSPGQNGADANGASCTSISTSGSCVAGNGGIGGAGQAGGIAGNGGINIR